MRFLTPDAEARLEEVRSDGGTTLVCLDFDGVLAPIVADPTKATIHPRAHDVLTSLGGRVAAVAIVTGRPVEQALELGALRELAPRLEDTGTTLTVRGQYGAQRWSSKTDEVVTAPPPPGLVEFEARLPGLLARADAADAFVEHKGLAVALHTRRMDYPTAAFSRLLPLVEEAAAESGLKVEPGRLVVEVRGGDSDKGDAIRELVDELHPSTVAYVGDDLGDVPAFRTVGALRGRGLKTLLVCSASDEEKALLDLADIAVDGPGEVMDLLALTWGPQG